MAICTECGFVSTSGEEKYCAHCGTALITKCPHCGAPINHPLARYCPICGGMYSGKKKHRSGKTKNKKRS